LLIIPTEIPVPTELATVYFRITPEAVTNAIRDIKFTSIESRRFDDILQMTIQGDDQGFDIAEPKICAADGVSLGNVSLQERAKLVGGETKSGRNRAREP
jgi:signal transduction histidine kinase